MTRALLVEPDLASRQLIAQILKVEGYEVCQAETLEGACPRLSDVRYDAVLAALSLPDGSGTELAETARALQPEVATVIIGENGDFDTAQEILGGDVDGYLLRPLNGDQVIATVAASLQRRLERQAARQHGDELRALVSAEGTAASDDPKFGELLLRRLARTAHFRDDETAAHMQRMAESCAAIARRLGFSDDDCERLRAAALLHDIGKVGVPDAVLRKPGKLNREERRLIECHPEYGHEILTGSGNDLIELAATVALSHHERPDGKGYPRRLKGEEIPLVGRIAAVADVFDALTNDRVYRPAYSIDEATEIMTKGRGTQFDPGVFDAFLEALPEITEIHERLPDAPADREVPAPVTAKAPTRVLIVEDHEAVARGLELLLRREGMEVAGTAFDLDGARALLQRRRPDVVVIDVDLGSQSGLDLIPDADRVGARVLLYTGRADPDLLAAAASSNALGVATKAGPPVELIAAVHAVADGKPYRDPRLLPTGRSGTSPQLSRREREVVTLLAQGLNGEEIAEALFLSPATIRTHVRNAMDKVGARTRAHLIAVAVAAGEISLPD